MTLNGVMNRKVRPKESLVAISLNVCEILEINKDEISKEELARIEILQRKIKAGYKDVEKLIKSNL